MENRIERLRFVEKERKRERVRESQRFRFMEREGLVNRVRERK